MGNKAYIDPVIYGFFKDESLELAERIGMALVEGAKHIDISFDKNILPHFEFNASPCGSFHFC